MGSDLRCQSALADDTRAWPFGAVGVDQVHLAVGLVIVATLLAVSARVDLCANSDALALFDKSDLGTNSDCATNDLWGCR